MINTYSLPLFFFFQAEDGIRDLVRSRGLGDVYKRQGIYQVYTILMPLRGYMIIISGELSIAGPGPWISTCLLYTSDAADERSSVDLGGRRIIKKTTFVAVAVWWTYE